jgi:hypothetical protein
VDQLRGLGGGGSGRDGLRRYVRLPFPADSGRVLQTSARRRREKYDATMPQRELRISRLPQCSHVAVSSPQYREERYSSPMHDAVLLVLMLGLVETCRLVA